MGEFKIKNATNFMLKAIDSDECIEIDYLNDFELDTEEGNEKYYNNEESLTFKVDTDKSKQLFVFNESETFDFDISFTFENIKYNITINNIPGRYVNDNPELVGEYCKNILYKLAEEGHKFVNGEIIDFQKYLV